MKKYLTFEEAVTELKSGKKIKNADWNNKHYQYLEIIYTQDFDDEKISPQRFIACFFKNGLLMPHPYSFTDLDIISDQSWMVVF